jgi:methyl-accepting chemotaxis protein
VDIALAALCGLVAGVLVAHFLIGPGKVGLKIRSTSGAGARAMQVETYLDSLEAFASSVTPVWSSHVSASRDQMQLAVAGITSKFAEIASSLDDIVASAQAALGDGHEAVFDASHRQLAEVIAVLDGTISQKNKTLEGLQALQGINSQMHAMTSEVTNIASQTRMLALNAAIQAAKVGEAGKVFGVVAMEVHNLADRSGVAGSRMAAMTDEVGRAISSAFALAEDAAVQEDTLVRDANFKVNAVLTGLRDLVTGLHRSSDHLARATQDVQKGISDTIVFCQFEDRVNQVLSHVTEAIDSFPTALLRAQGDGVEQLRPLDCPAMIEKLRDSYTMVDERRRHAPVGAATPVETECDVTFFD